MDSRPWASRIIFSIDLGPRVVLMMSATACGERERCIMALRVGTWSARGEFNALAAKTLCKHCQREAIKQGLFKGNNNLQLREASAHS